MNLDFLHPYPRYGVAVALYHAGLRHPDALPDEAAAARLAAETLDAALNQAMLYTGDDPTLPATTTLRFTYLEGDRVDPGKAGGQTAARGYYTAPHVLTSDMAAGATIGELRALRDALRGNASPLVRTRLKRSFSPLTAKLNAGSSVMSEPTATLLAAAFTAIATATRYKPAAWSYDTGNLGLIPDLPLADGPTSPLLDFVHLFQHLSEQYRREGAFTAEVRKDKREYRRPPIFFGNYPEAPGCGGIGAVGLLAAIGRWVREGGMLAEDPRGERLKKVLDLLGRRALYLVGYRSTSQERFGHHLVGLATRYDLGRALREIRNAPLIGIESWSDPRRELFRKAADRFLRFFSPSAFRDFLAFRAEYPASFAPILMDYAMQQMNEMKLNPELIASARAYGATLNYAAYKAANDEVEDDKRSGRSLRSLTEYKQRFLVELESAVLSAPTGPALLMQVGSRLGRIAALELPASAAPFMEAVALERDRPTWAAELIIAFMRLSTFKEPTKERAAAPADVTAEMQDFPEPVA